MLTLSNAASISDLRRIAKRRLPRFAFDFIDGGAEDENCLARNRETLDSVELVPRYLIGAATPDTRVRIFEQTFSVPFGVAPMGLLNMAWPKADLTMARLAARESIPIVVSTASSTSLEEMAEAGQGHAWFQIYVTPEEALLEKLLQRAKTAGYRVLVVTVDVAQPGKRDRDVRNGLRVPFRPGIGTAADLLLHPRWSLQTLRAGPPALANFRAKDSMAEDSPSLSRIQSTMISRDLKWDDLRRLRDSWEGPLVIKGLLHPADAERAVNEGYQGIVVSNHGGRQADYAPASAAALPAVVRAVAGRIPVLFDSGVRRGADAIRAKALGADFALAGRAFAYGLAAGGEAGAAAAFQILKSELSSALGQLGLQDFGSIDASILFREHDTGQ